MTNAPGAGVGILSTATAHPDWTQLWGFGYALAGGATFAAGVCVVECWTRRVRPWAPLVGLPDTWNLSDSLVTNVTVVGGALTGVVGSTDVVKALLTAHADVSLALATVGAAIATGILSLAVVVLRTFRNHAHFTLFGLLAAAAVTLAGAYGEIFVVWQNGRGLPLGGWQHRLWWIALILGVLLLAYATVSLKETIAQGLGPRPDNAPAEAQAEALTARLLDLSRSAEVPQLEREIRIRGQVRAALLDRETPGATRKSALL